MFIPAVKVRTEPPVKDRSDWSGRWHGMLYLICWCLLVLGLLSIISDKSVTNYYLGQSEYGGPGVCVKANAQWYLDQVVFCTDDASKALLFVEAANLTLRPRMDDKTTTYPSRKE